MQRMETASYLHRVQNTYENRISSTVKHTDVLTKQKVSLPRASQSLTGSTLLASVPVTPDPNSSLKSKKRSKNDAYASRPTKASKRSKDQSGRSHSRLNKFVRRLHDMLIREKHSGIVEWRRGLLVLFSTDAFSKRILPRYFNTRNFKTFRRQLNYYGFVHVRSFSATGNTTTALWINQNLAEDEANDDVSAVLKLRRVEPDKIVKTVEGRRLRKALAIHTVEEDIGLNSKTLQLDQIRSMAISGIGMPDQDGEQSLSVSPSAAFLRPFDSSGSCGRVQPHTGFSSEGCGRESTISLVDTKVAVKYNGFTSTIWGSNNGAAEELSPSMPKPGDEVANTDAAASVLLMLSRS